VKLLYAMADPLSVASAIAGLISLTVQIAQISHAYTSSAMGARKTVASLVQELLILRNILSDLQTSLIVNPSLAEAFGSDKSAVLGLAVGSQGDGAEIKSKSSNTKQPLHEASLLKSCEADLKDLLEKTQKKADKLRKAVSVTLLTWPLSEADTQKKVSMLHRYQSLFQAAINVDTLALVASTHNYLIKKDNEKLATEEEKTIMSWLSPLAFEAKHRDTTSKRHPDTGKWFLESEEFQRWLKISQMDEEELSTLLEVSFEIHPQPISREALPRGCRRLGTLDSIFCDNCTKTIEYVNKFPVESFYRK
jgi:hypothetical protein